ncbi:NUDIX hydrolase [candidate division KSB1 bacterium]|nr:NUDIX hydrolase [candidate division KSB1 bacterium]
MTKTKPPYWLQWAQKIQALSQTGLTFCTDEYNRERYQQLGQIAAEIVETHSGLPKKSVSESFSLQNGYATPKVDVRGVIISDGKILLVQERSDERWCLPGGWADVGESPTEMVVREVWEESGFKVEAKKVIGVYDANRDGRPVEFYHAYKIIFLCEITGGTARPSYETLAVDFFDFDNLPPLSSNRTSEKHLNEIVNHLKAPDRKTYFE